MTSFTTTITEAAKIFEASANGQKAEVERKAKTEISSKPRTEAEEKARNEAILRWINGGPLPSKGEKDLVAALEREDTDAFAKLLGEGLVPSYSLFSRVVMFRLPKHYHLETEELNGPFEVGIKENIVSKVARHAKLIVCCPSFQLNYDDIKDFKVFLDRLTPKVAHAFEEMAKHFVCFDPAQPIILDELNAHPNQTNPFLSLIDRHVIFGDADFAALTETSQLLSKLVILSEDVKCFVFGSAKVLPTNVRTLIMEYDPRLVPLNVLYGS